MIWIAAILMDAETEGDDGIEGLQFLLLPLPKRRRSRCFDNCIICQSDSKENLRKGKQSSVKNFISKLQIRQDDVYERLSPNFDVLYNKEVLWHASCYATYTSEQNIKYATKHQSSMVQKADIKCAKATNELCARISRSKAVPHDWSKCLFCKNRTLRQLNAWVCPRLHDIMHECFTRDLWGMRLFEFLRVATFVLVFESI